MSGNTNAASFAITTATDSVDVAPGDGLCEDALGECSLRAALQEANTLAGPDTINVPAGVYSLGVIGSSDDAASSGDLDVRQDVEIVGVGSASTIIDGGGTDRVIDNHGAVVTLRNLTIRNGNTGSDPGAGIRSDGALSLIDVVLSGNRTTGFGGGIYAATPTSTLVLLRVSLSNNEAQAGAGVYASELSTSILLTDTTFDTNTASGSGGGIYLDKSSFALDRVTFANNKADVGGGVALKDVAASLISNGTFSRNDAGSLGGGIHTDGGVLGLINVTLHRNRSPSGAGIMVASGSATLKNTILANSISGSNCAGSITSAGWNLDSGNSCGFASTGDLTNLDPLLGPLQTNGGDTASHALLIGSPAVDNGDNTGCPAVDQRFGPRPLDGNGSGTATCDMGSYEFSGVASVSDLRISNDDGINQYTPGATLTYTVTVTNDGPAPLRGAQVTNNVTALPQVDSASWTCVASGGAACTPGPVVGDISDRVSLPSSGSVTYTLQAIVSSSASGDLINTATVVLPAWARDPDLTNNIATDTDVEPPMADLGITNDDGAASYTPGGTVSYTIVVTNAGPDDVTSATVSDLVTGSGLVASASWVCVATGAANCTAGPVAGDISDTVDLPVGETLTYTLDVTLNSDATGSLVNTASVAPPAGITDSNAVNDSVVDTDSQGPAVADLSITKDDLQADFTPGGVVVYRIDVFNAGPSDITGATVTDLVMGLPQVVSATWVCSPTGAATCNTLETSGNINDTVSIPVGDSLTYKLAVTLSSTADGNLINTASVSVPAAASDPNLANNTDTDTNSSGGLVADLTITMDDSTATYTPGSTTSYTIEVSNLGPSDIKGVSVTDAVMGLAPVASATWSCVATGFATCTAGPVNGNINDVVSLPVGDTLTYTLDVGLRSDATAMLDNTATVAVPVGASDPVADNNSAQDSNAAAPVVDLSVTKDDGALTYTSGETVSYTIVVSNAGPSDVTGATVGDDFLSLPPVVSGSWDCVATGSASCTPGTQTTNISDTVNIPVGETLTYSVDLVTSPGATGDLANAVTVGVPVGTTDSELSNNTALDTNTNGPATADLSITKTDGTTTYTPGGVLTYTIVASNAGPSNVTGATVTDAIVSVPQVGVASWTCVGADGGTCGAAAGPGNISDTVDLPVGGTVTYTLNVLLDSSASGDLTNTASIAAPGGMIDPDPLNNSASDLNSEGPAVADLVINKDDGSATYTPGTSTSYTLVVSNLGPSDITNATVTDNVLSAPQVSGATWSCVATGIGSCSAGPTSGNINDTVNLPVGETLTYTLDVDLRSSATGTLSNTASVAVPVGASDPVAANNTATDDDSATPVADLAVTKDNGQTTYIPGGSTTYTIVVSNAGPSDAVSADVDDPVTDLPQVTSATWTCVATGTATCNAGPVTGNLADTISVPVGETVTYTIVAGLEPGASGDLTNSATVAPSGGATDPVNANNKADDTDSIMTTADLSISMDDGVTSYTPGASVTYTIVATNLGPSHVSGATVSDAVTGLAPVTGATWTCVAAGGGSCTAGPVPGDINDTVNLPVGATATYTLVADLDSGATANLVNQATIAAPAGVTDTNGANDTAQDTDTAGPVADLSITKDDGATTYTPGLPVTYTIAVTNAGPSDVSGATVADPVTALAEVTSATWSCVAAGGATCAAGLAAGGINDTVNLPVGGTVTYTLIAQTNPAATSPLVNTATIAVPAGASDPAPANNSNSDTNTATPSVDLSVTKTDGVSSYTPGGSVTYTIVASNAGPSAVAGASVDDAVTALAQVSGATWTCAGTNGGTCTTGPETGDIVDTVNLPPGGSVTYTLDVDLSAGASGNLINAVNVSVPGGLIDPTPANNSASDTDTVAPVADLSISKTDGATSYTPGAPVTYTIIVNNAGPSSVTSASVTDLVLAQAQVTEASWTCSSTGSATCTAGPVNGNISDTINIPVGDTVTYTLVADLDPAATGDLANTAVVAMPPGGTDPAAGNNSATDISSAGAPVADLSLTKSDGITEYTPGVANVYTIVVANAGPSSIVGATVTDNVTGLTQVSGANWTCTGASGATCGAGLTPGNINDVVNLPVGSSVTYTLTAGLASGATGPLTNTASVTLPVGASDPAPENNSADDTDTQGAPVADLGITKTDGVTTYTPGGALTYTLQVTNAGPSDVTGATVTDALSAVPQIATASWTCSATAGAACTTGPVVGDIGDSVTLPVGGTLTYSIDVTISTSATDNLSNTAAVAPPAGGSDPVSANDTALDTDTRAAISDLNISITDGVSSYTPGTQLTYTIVAGNAGPSDVVGATITSPVTASAQVNSASWTCTAAGGASCAAGPEVGDLNDLADIPVGGTVTYTLIADLDPAASGSLTSTASIVPPGGKADPSNSNNSATDVDNAGSLVSDIAVTIDDGLTSYTPGTPTTYTIVVANAGPSSVDGVTLLNEITLAPQVTGATWTCVGAGGATCTAGPVVGDIFNDTIDMPAGSSATYTLIASLDPDATGDLVSAATISAGGAIDPDSGNDTAVDTDSEGPEVADLSITKDDGVGSYTPGGSLTYTVVVSNAGPSSITGVTVSDPLLGLPQIVGATWTCVGAGGASCTAGPQAGDVLDNVDMPVGSSATYTIVADLDPAATGNLVNTATVTESALVIDPNGANNSATDTDARGQLVADLQITKDDGVGSYTPGTSVTYSVVVTNLGPSSITGATVTDALTSIPQQSSISWTCVGAGGGVCTSGPSAGDINDTVDLPFGATVTYTALVNILPGATGAMTNTASVAVAAAVSDPVGGNNTAVDVDSVAIITDMGITNDDGVGTYTPGTFTDYTITVNNAGPSSAIDVQVVDNVTALPQVSSASWTCVGAGGAVCPAGPVAGGINETLDMPVGSSVTYTLRANLRSDGSGDLVNLATVGLPVGSTDPNPANDSASDTDTVNPIGDLSITKDNGVASYAPGGFSDYVIVVGNAGPSDIVGATVSDPVTSLPQVTSASWTCTAAGGASCPAGPVAGDLAEVVTVPVGGTLTYVLTANYSAAASGAVVNTAIVGVPAGSTDPALANNSATDTDAEAPSRRLSGTIYEDVDSDADLSGESPRSGVQLQLYRDDGDNVPEDTDTLLRDVSTDASGSYDFVLIPGTYWLVVDSSSFDAPDIWAEQTHGGPGSWCDDGTGTPVERTSQGACYGGRRAEVSDVTATPSSGEHIARAALTVDRVIDLGFSVGVIVNARDGDDVGGSRTIQGSLRQALLNGNALSGQRLIHSHIPGSLSKRIRPTSELPELGDDTILDATTQEGFAGTPVIEIDGSLAGDSDALVIDGRDCTIRGFSIHSFEKDGIRINGAGGNTIQGNFIGVDPTGTIALGLESHGIHVSSPNNTIGGSGPGEPNILSAIGKEAFSISDGRNGNVILGNLIGTDITGTVAIPNGAEGFKIKSDGNTIGGTGPGEGNVIANNGSVGILLERGAANNQIHGNFIGTDRSGTRNFGSGSHGIRLNHADNNEIGGTGAGEGNTIAFNGGDGVAINNGDGNAIQGNSIHSNQDLGIDLEDDGVTPNDPGDSDGGPNRLQNFPVLTTVVGVGAQSQVVGSLDSTPNTVFRIEYFANDTTDPSGFGEGQIYLGSHFATTNAGGIATWTELVPFMSPVGRAVSATATSAAGNTSEFGNIETATSISDLSLTKNVNDGTPLVGSDVVFSVVISNAGPTQATTIVARDVLPDGYVYVSDDGGGAYDSSTGLWSIPSISVGATATLNITATVQLTGNYTNVAEILSMEQVDPDSTLGNGVGNGEDDEDSVSTAPVPSTDLSITKDDGATDFTPGGQATYTVVVTNAGPSIATGATVSDAVLALPNVTSATWTCVATAGGSCTPGPVAGDISDTVNLPVGGSATYTLTVSLDPAQTGNLVNTATVAAAPGSQDPAGANNTASDTNTAGPAIADLSISVDDGVTVYTAGTSVTYTIVASNAGPSNIVGATVADAVTALPQVADATWTCAAAGGAVCAAGPIVGDINDTVDIPVGGTVTYTLQANLISSATGDLTNTATIAVPAGATDPDGTDDSATDIDLLGQPIADVSIAKDSGAAAYTPGAPVTYTIVVSNAGPSDASGVTVTDAVTALPQVTGATWTCVGAAGATCTAGPVAGDLNDTANVPVGGTATYTLIAALDPDATGDLINSADVALPVGGVDPIPANNTASDTDAEGGGVADLSVTKTDGQAGYVPGTAINYTITVTNAGPSSITGATVIDNASAETKFTGTSWTCVPSAGATCSAGPVVGDISDTVDLAVGSSVTYTLTATIDSLATGLLANTASVTAPIGVVDPNGANNSSTDTNTEGPAIADLTITKDDGATTYTPGADVTYTIVVGNAGPSASYGAVVADAVTALPQVTGATWTCVATGAGSCTAGPISGDLNDTPNIPPGETVTYTLVATTDPGATGDLINTATVNPPAGATDPSALNNTATDTDSEGPGVADLSITNDNGVTTFTPGDVSTYAIVVANAGPSHVSGATVTDAVVGLSQVSGATWMCLPTGGATCMSGPIVGDLNDTVNVPVGGTLTYTLQVDVEAGATGNLVTTAMVAPPAGVSDPDLANNSSVDSDSEGDPVSDLSITTDDGVASYTPGGSVVYTVVATNTGPSFIYGATITDSITSLPQVTGASWTCVAAGGATCTAGPVSGNLNDTVDIPLGASVTYALTATLDPAATGNLVHSISIAPPPAGTDPNAANNTATDVDAEGTRIADLTITKDDGEIEYTPGGSVTYTIVAGNVGPSSILGATVADAVTALPQVTGASWTCVAAGGASCNPGPVTGDLADTPNLPVGGTATYTLQATIDPAATGDLINTATVVPPVTASDPVAANDSATDTDAQGPPAADLGITIDDGQSAYTPGSTYTYTVAVTNAGPSSVTGATVSSAIASAPQVVSASWTCVGASGATCTAGPVAGDINDTTHLPFGSTATYSVTVNLDPSAVGDLTVSADVAAPPTATDLNAANDSAQDVDFEGAPTADFQVVIDDGATEYTPGTQLTYTVLVTNAGPSSVVDGTVTDAVTALAQVANASWNCTPSAGASCTAGPVTGDINDTVTVPAGGTLAYTVVVDVDPAAAGDLAHTVAVALPPTGTDPDPTSNSATDLNAKGADVADLSITKDDGQASYTPGGSVDYTITVANAGPSSIVGATVADPVTGLAQVAGATWTCIPAGGAACTAGPVAGDINDTVNLPRGGSLVYTLTATVDPGASGNLVNTATVAVPAGASDPDAANNTATDDDAAGAPEADLSITKDDGQVAYTPGTSVTYTIVVGNAGPSHITGAMVRDAVTALPQITGASWTCVGAGGGTCPAGPVSGDINDMPDVPVGGTVTYNVVAAIDPSATGDLINTATVAVPAGSVDSNATNDSATDTDTQAPPQADLSLTMSVDNPTPVANDNVVFTLSVLNSGPSTADNVVVLDPLPTGYVWVGDTSAGSYDTATGEWAVGTLVVGASASMQVTVRVLSVGNHTSQAEVMTSSADDPDSTPGNGFGNGEDDEAEQATTPSGTDAVVDITDNGLPGDVMTISVDDDDMNSDLAAADTMVLDVVNDMNNESETVTLTETGPSTGVFQNTVATTFGTTAGTDDDGTFNVQAGDTLTLSYMDQVRSTPGPLMLTDQAAILGGADAVLFITPNIVPGEPFTLRVTDADPNTDLLAADSVQVTVVDDITGESETVTLTETGSSTGIFEALLPTVLGDLAGADDDGTLTTSIGHSVTMSYDDALTANGSTATVTTTALVSTLDAVLLTKAAGLNEITVGSAVPYVITATNNTVATLNGILISDALPVGFKYVADTARLLRAGPNGTFGDGDDIVVPLTPTGPRPLEFSPIDLAAGETIELHYVLRTGSGVINGTNVNQATPMFAGFAVGNTARATVEVIDDPILGQSTIIGKVFQDLDADGVQDEGELGVPQAMVVLDDGTYILTDEFGRYHFPAVTAGHRMLKLNMRSLPPGSKAVGDVSEILWITPGLAARANFGVRITAEAHSIGRPVERGMSVAGDVEHHPTRVLGKAEELSLLINDRLVDLPQSELTLSLRDINTVAMIRGGRFEQPLKFRLELDDTAAVESWRITVMDAHGAELHAFDGAGAPPSDLDWDGKLQSGELLPPGQAYLYQITVSYEDGTQSLSPRNVFGVGRDSIISLELAGGAFEVDGVQLSAEAKAMLDEVGEVLTQYPDERLLIEGHTDNQGTDDYNMSLSRRRAESAAAHLMQSFGLAEDRLVLRWYGESRPAATNDLPEGRIVNRRVVLRAEVEDVDSTHITDRYRGQASATINDLPVELGARGRFTAEVEQDGQSALMVAVENSAGRSVQTVIPLPRLEVTSPQGELLVGEHAPSVDCRMDDDQAVCTLSGRTDPGVALAVNGEEVPVAEDGAFSKALELPAGDHVFGLLVRNEAGYSRSANLAIQVADRDADGNMLIVTQAIPNLTLNLPPSDTKLYNKSLPLTGMTDVGNKVFVNDEPIAVGADGAFESVVDLPAGDSRLVVRVQDAAGNEGSIERDVSVANTQLFLLAFGDAEVGRLSNSGAIEGTEHDDDYYTEGRLAFYLKGVIRGKYLITAAFDSGRDELGELFSDLGGDETDRLIQNLDPDRYYPVYGDSSTLVYDAQSQGKLYLALESDTINAILGDYPLSLNDTELATYQRTLYGARFSHRTVSRTEGGRPNMEVLVFTADARHAHVQDELLATGGSLYYLSHRDIIEGSEEVTILVRDKNTGLIISRERQRRNVDYVIKYPEGRLMFQRNISRTQDDGQLVDQAILSGHPVYIQADYETLVEAFDKTTSGVRVKRQVGNNVSVGGTYIKDDLESGEYELGAIDAEIRAGEHSRFVLEYADSSGADSLVYTSSDGGLSYTAQPVSGAAEGSAFKVAAELDVGSWFGTPDRFHVELYRKELESGFFSSGNFLEQGSDKMGLHADLQVTDNDTVQLRFDEEDRNGTSTTSSALWRHRESRWRVSAEIFQLNREDASGVKLEDSSLGAVRFWSELTKKLSGLIEHQSVLSGEDNDQTSVGMVYQVLPSLALEAKATDGSRGSSTEAGAVFAFGDSSIYVTERATDDPTAGSNTSTVVGARAPIGKASKVYTEYRLEDGERSDKAISLVGIQRQWEVARGLRILLSGESSDSDDGSSTSQRSTLAAGVVWSVPERISLTSRNELNRESGTNRRDQILAYTKFDLKLSDDFTLQAKYRYSKTEDRDTNAVEARIDERGLGLAYRPTRSDRFNAFAQYTHLLDQRPLGARDLNPLERSMDVISLETVFSITPRVEWVTKEAARMQEERSGTLPEFESTTLLFIQRLNISIWKPIILGVEVRSLRETEADDQKDGWLTEVMWKIRHGFRVGAGYNFTDFNDNEFSQNDYSSEGWFFRVQGRY